jgi:medium-chain acyl-CoA ligase, mitochondrial
MELRQVTKSFLSTVPKYSLLPLSVFVDLVEKQQAIKVKLPDIPLANTGGAICTPKLVRDVENILKVKKLQSIYGLTECTAAVFQSFVSDKNEIVQEFVGCVSDHSEAKVVDKDGNAVPFGEPGELYVRGFSTMLGYSGDKEKTNEVVDADKWLKTGDQFVLLENGYGKVVGRLKEMIIRGGENLFPREIEDFLNTHPNIMEAHVVS